MADTIKLYEIEEKNENGKWVRTTKLPINYIFSSLCNAEKWAKKMYPKGNYRIMSNTLSVNTFYKIKKRNNLQFVG